MARSKTRQLDLELLAMHLEQLEECSVAQMELMRQQKEAFARLARNLEQLSALHAQRLSSRPNLVLARLLGPLFVPNADGEQWEATATASDSGGK